MPIDVMKAIPCHQYWRALQEIAPKTVCVLVFANKQGIRARQHRMHDSDLRCRCSGANARGNVDLYNVPKHLSGPLVGDVKLRIWQTRAFGIWERRASQPP